MFSALFGAALFGVAHVPLHAPEVKDRQFDDLKLETPVDLEPLTDAAPGTRVWRGVVKNDKGNATQAIGVVITDLTAVNPNLTPSALCEAHDQIQRNRPGFSRAVFNTQYTTLGERPFVVVYGSMIGPSGNGTNLIPHYVVSAATTRGTKAYEVNWITTGIGDDLSAAFRAVRRIRFLDGDRELAPKALVGTAGGFTFAPASFCSFELPATPAPDHEIKPLEGQAMRYRATLRRSNFLATIELVENKDENFDQSPRALLRQLGYEFWKEDQAPKVTEVDGKMVVEDLPISDGKRHLRIELACRGKYVVGYLVSAETGKPFPSAETMGLRVKANP